MVSLTGEGDVSGFLYGKLQRATSIYGSGLVGPATAIVHGNKDLTELLPPRVSKIASPKQQLKNLETMLWNQFGMATCEGSVEREDLMTPMSYLKPRLCDLRDTLVFLDATTTSMRGKNAKSAGGGGGLGGLFSSVLGNKKSPQQQNPPPQNQPPQPGTDTNDFWLDMDLVRSGVTRGSSVFVVCESQDTEDCAKALSECLLSIGNDDDDTNSKININSIVTLIAPDENVALGGPDDAQWNSLRPQDLEGELSQTVSVRDGTADFVWEEEEPEEEAPAAAPSFKRTREERLAAAYSEEILPPPPPKPKPKPTQSLHKSSEARMAAASNYKPPSNLSRQDLAEVCVQCALRLPTVGSSSSSYSPVRVVRVAPVVDDASKDADHSERTERPNRDYFTLTGGPKAKAKACVVTSVDWTKTLSCFVTGGTGDASFGTARGSSNSVKEFPKRPDVA